jgi:alpha-1,2-mannosyltransferase
VIATLAAGFTTPIWSVAANGIWPHTITVLGIAGCGWASSTRRWWLVGLFGGVVLWGRLHAALIVAVLALYIAWRRRDPAIALKVGGVGAVALALICAWSRWMYGTWSPTASYDTTVFEDFARDHRIDLVNQLGMWVSPDRGILIWTPLVVVLLVPLVRSWSSLPDWTRGLVLGGLAYTILQASLNRFSGGEVFYGYRLGLEMLACLVPALALSARNVGPVARLLLGPVIALQFVAVAVGASTDRFFVPADEVWHENAFRSALLANQPVLLATLLLAVGVAILVQRRLRSAPSRGTVSSHSVP